MAPDTSFLLIGKLATKANTTKDTIRHYDQLGLLKSRKRQAGSRLYTEFHPECVERIELIKSAQAIGFTLTEIKDSSSLFIGDILKIPVNLVTPVPTATATRTMTPSPSNNSVPPVRCFLAR